MTPYVRSRLNAAVIHNTIPKSDLAIRELGITAAKTYEEETSVDVN